MKIPALAALIAALLMPMPALATAKAHAVAHMAGRHGQALGVINFNATAHGVLIEMDLHGLPPGPHAIQIHTSGNCDTHTAFTSAGPIWSLTPGRRHGFLAKGGPLSGDLPNQFAGADGRLRAETITSAFSLGNGKKSVFDRDGASIMVTARGDDYLSQPGGNAGERIACGVIDRTIGPASRRKRTKAR
jgi:Cu-Zn family superoxide dismutase